jgi:hypothetical protein
LLSLKNSVYIVNNNISSNMSFANILTNLWFIFSDFRRFGFYDTEKN